MKSLNSYLRRAWSDLSSDEGWWRVILVLGLLNCVPLVGQVFMLGYVYDWAKEAAWGMKGGPSHDSGDIGRRGKYGLMVLGVLIVWTAPIIIVAELLRFVPVMGGVLCFLVELICVFVSVIASAAALRSIIYERMMPGLQIGRVLKMARRDPGGLWQAFAISLLNVVLLIAALFLLLLPAGPFAASIVSSTPEQLLGSNLIIIVLLGMFTVVVALVVWVAGSVLSTLINALYARALGYWMEQFEPRKWKSPADPMPFEIQMEKEKKEKAEAKARAKAEKRAKNNKAEQPEQEPDVQTGSEDDTSDLKRDGELADANSAEIADSADAAAGSAEETAPAKETTLPVEAETVAGEAPEAPAMPPEAAGAQNDAHSDETDEAQELGR